MAIPDLSLHNEQINFKKFQQPYFARNWQSGKFQFMVDIRLEEYVDFQAIKTLAPQAS